MTLLLRIISLDTDMAAMRRLFLYLIDPIQGNTKENENTFFSFRAAFARRFLFSSISSRKRLKEFAEGQIVPFECLSS